MLSMSITIQPGLGHLSFVIFFFNLLSEYAVPALPIPCHDTDCQSCPVGLYEKPCAVGYILT